MTDFVKELIRKQKVGEITFADGLLALYAKHGLKLKDPDAHAARMDQVFAEAVAAGKEMIDGPKSKA